MRQFTLPYDRALAVRAWGTRTRVILSARVACGCVQGEELLHLKPNIIVFAELAHTIE